MRFIRNLPLAHRLLLGFMVVALVPLVVTNALTMGVLNSSLQSQADENARSHLIELEVRLEDLLARSGETCASICSDGNISLSLIDSSGYLNTNVYLALYKASNALHSGVDLSLYDAGGRQRFTTNASLAPSSLPVNWGVLRKAGSASGTVYYSPGVDTASPYQLYTAQSLYHGAAMVGYTVVSMRAEVFLSLLTGSGPEQSTVFLLDSVGRPVSATRPLAEVELAVLRNWLADSEGVPLVYEGQHYYAAKSAESGFYLVLRQPAPLTGNTLRSMRGITLMAAALSLFLSLLISALISRGISRPVSRLSHAMSQVQEGELAVQVSARHGDELGLLTERFNRMTAQLKLQMENSVRQQREMDESQIRLLQAQLNPHFLYNTLDTIKWMAKINGIPDIAKITSNLAVILRQCVSSSQFVTLRQELDMVRGYTDIQRIRFSGRFEYLVDLPPALENCVIPKLILQPLVENAILHGLSEKESGYVYLYATAPDEDTLVISVTDDGQGMPPETVERLSQVESKIVEGHLGLYNVNHIIKMNYGKEYGLKASSILGVGTTVTMVLPLRKGESDV